MKTKKFEVNPIETLYSGVLFRSRTEARWAVFFDSLTIKWVYEFEGYDLGYLGYYLPDFYLPEYDGSGLFVEVKGKKFEYIELLKCHEFCKITKNKIIMLDGIPDFKAYDLFVNDVKIGLYKYNGIFNADQAEYENRLFSCPGYEEKDGTINTNDYDLLGASFINAVNYSKSYRF